MIDIRKILEDDLKKYKNKDYLFEKVNDKYESITFDDFILKVKRFATYLVKNNKKNKTILLIGKNSINYMIADVAIAVYTGTVINLNRDTKEEELIGIINSMNVSAIVYTNEQTEKISNLKRRIKRINIDKIINKLDEVIDDYKDNDIDSCSKIFFSSGTTSKPKGVKLSLRNVFAGWEPLQMRTKFSSEDVVYLWLPLSHTYANIYNFYYSFLSGLSIYLGSSVNNIASELREVNPTIFCGVPLIYERLYEGYKENINIAFGNRIKFIYCGGAPINLDIKQKYLDKGLQILNAYALTETASSFSIEYPFTKVDSSCGTIFENMDVKLIDVNSLGIGEIVCKGECVFLGYTDSKNTKNVFTDDGYFMTGDLGYIKDNKLYVTGRKKRVLIGSNGENVFVDEVIDKLKELDNNINNVSVSLVNNKIKVELFLEDKDKTNIEELIDKYNKKVVQKNKIEFYEVSKKKRKEKLM